MASALRKIRRHAKIRRQCQWRDTIGVIQMPRPTEKESLKLRKQQRPTCEASAGDSASQAQRSNLQPETHSYRTSSITVASDACERGDARGHTHFISIIPGARVLRYYPPATKCSTQVRYRYVLDMHCTGYPSTRACAYRYRYRYVQVNSIPGYR